MKPSGSMDDWFARKESNEHRWAYIRAHTTRTPKCPICDLHLCICQSVLGDFEGFESLKKKIKRIR